MAIQSASPTNLAPAGRPLTEAEIQAFGAEFKQAVMGSSRVQNALKEREYWVNHKAALDQKGKDLDQESQALAKRKAELTETQVAAESELEKIKERRQVIDEKKKALFTPMFFGIVHGKKPLPESKTEVEKISALALKAISLDASKKSHFISMDALFCYLDDHPELWITTLS